jgi:dTMP kinase
MDYSMTDFGHGSGKYIVVEGPEGVGKTTQINEIGRRIQAAGLPVRILREPDSQSDLTARAIRLLTQDPRYPMNTHAEVLLYNAARAQSLQVIRRSVEQGVVCLVDRNYLTTLGIQFYGRGDIPDYTAINNIISFAVDGVEPDLCIIMDAPAQVLVERAAGRGAGERFDNLERQFLERVRAGYLWEANQRTLPVVDATEPLEVVTETIWRLVSNTLARRGPSRALGRPETQQPGPEPESDAAVPPEAEKMQPGIGAKSTASADGPAGPYVKKNKNGSYTITAAGKAWLQDAVTDVDGDVYATKSKLGSITAAAAMARLSRRGDDMRVTVLDEFADQVEKDGKLIHRVITAYGDDSVQQLVGQHIVVEKATKLMSNIIERSRLAAYLEQSTRYIYYDQKDAHGKYRYYIPASLPDDIRREYIIHMEAIFDTYSAMVHTLTNYVRDRSDTPEAERDIAWKGATRAQACDAARLVLPTATTTTIGIFASGQALEGMIMRLRGDELPEARDIAEQLLTEARKVIPAFLERADKPERGGAITAYGAETQAAVATIAQRQLPQGYADGKTESVTLSDYWPRNELDIVADMLYRNSHLPLSDIRREVTGWTYEQKAAVMKTYFGERLNRRHKPGRALEKIHYSWDLVCDFGIFCDLQRHRIVDDMEWQEMTPRYGYEIPDLVEAAGLSEAFEECFDISLKLHSLLVQAGCGTEAQYATLLGHKMRWKVTYNAREAFHLHELRTSPQGHPGYRRLVQEMHARVAEVHPIIAEAMRFVNQDEDPALTRLAAARYTQFKLTQLEGKSSGHAH